MKWLTVQAGMVEHTINAAHIAHVTPGLSGAKVLHLSSGELIVVGPREWQKLWAEINQADDEASDGPAQVS